MDIDRVRYFHVVAECGSLVKASEILNISQPALSKAMRRLEEETGLTLFLPEGRGLKMSDSAHKFRMKTADLLKKWLDVPRSLDSASTENESTLKIGSFEVFTTYFLKHLNSYVDFKSLELHEYGPGHLEQALAEGKIDIGITYVPIPKTGIEFVEVAKVEMGTFGIGKYKTHHWETLPFVVPLSPIQGTPSKVMGLDGWPDHKYPRIRIFQVTMMESAIQLCRRGLCVGYFPKFIAEFQNQIVMPEFKFFELDCPVPKKERTHSVYLVKRSGSKESSLYRQIAKSLRGL